MKKIIILLIMVVVASTSIMYLTSCNSSNKQNATTHIPDSITINTITINGDKQTTVNYNSLTGITVVQDSTLYIVDNSATMTAIELAIQNNCKLDLKIIRENGLTPRLSLR